MSKTYHNKKNKPTTGTFYLDFLSVSFIIHKNLQSTVDFNESIIYQKRSGYQIQKYNLTNC